MFLMKTITELVYIFSKADRGYFIDALSGKKIDRWGNEVANLVIFHSMAIFRGTGVKKQSRSF